MTDIISNEDRNDMMMGNFMAAWMDNLGDKLSASIQAGVMGAFQSALDKNAKDTEIKIEEAVAPINDKVDRIAINAEQVPDLVKRMDNYEERDRNHRFDGGDEKKLDEKVKTRAGSLIKEICEVIKDGKMDEILAWKLYGGKGGIISKMKGEIKKEYHLPSCWDEMSIAQYDEVSRAVETWRPKEGLGAWVARKDANAEATRKAVLGGYYGAQRMLGYMH